MKPKKILAVTISAVMVTSILSVPLTSKDSVASDTAKSIVSQKSNVSIYGDFEYKITNGNVVLTKYKGNDESVTLPSRINGMTVTRIGECCFECSDISKVVIPDSVTSIGGKAFKNCIYLSDVIFSKNITKIEIYAFERCESLKKVILPGKLKYLGADSFYGCSSLSEVFIPKTLEDFTFSFGACNNLKKVIFEKGIKIIPRMILWGSKVESIVIPEGVEKIEYGAFKDCTKLRKITIPDSVTTIEDDIVNPKPGTYPIIIYCNKNTEAQRYARRSALPCVIMDVNPNMVIHPTLGDVDGDGVITANDALIILRASVEMYQKNDLKRCGDVNSDGVVDSADAHAVLRMSVQ